MITAASAKMFHLKRLCRVMDTSSALKRRKSVLGNRRPWLWLASLLTLGVSLSAELTPAQPNTTKATNQNVNTILIGQSIPLTGASGELGKQYKAGAISWFKHINKQGGIHGKTIKLISLDDQYEPEQTIVNTQNLLEKPGLLALFGFIGTPTSKVVLPIVERKRVPFIAPLTGASILRDKNLKMVFNMRASYSQEIQAIVDSLVRSARQRIAIIYQDDAFGNDGLQAAEAALSRHNLKAIVTTTVKRNSANVRNAVNAIAQARPNAILIISAYVSSAAVSKAIRDKDMNVQIMNVSFVGTQALEKALPPGEANGIGISQVVPFPWNRSIPVVAKYQRIMREENPNSGYSFTSLEGFIAAQMLTTALEEAGKNPSRAKLIESLESLKNLDIGGYAINFSSDNRQGSDYVELTFLGAQQWEP